MKYLVITPLWSRPHNKLFNPGEVADFPPNPKPKEGFELPPDAIVVDFDLLIKMGVIAPYTAEAVRAAFPNRPDLLPPEPEPSQPPEPKKSKGTE